MSSACALLRQQPLRLPEASRRRRRLAPAALLQLLDPRPGRRALPFHGRDEGLSLRAVELGEIGADRLAGERGTLHAANLAPAVCRKSVLTWAKRPADPEGNRPNLRRVATFYNPENPAAQQLKKVARDAARSLNSRLSERHVASVQDLRASLQALSAGEVDAICYVAMPW